MGCVTNGCNGKCCENFTFPASIEDMKRLRENIVEWKSKDDRFNNFRRVESETGFYLDAQSASVEDIDFFIENFFEIGRLDYDQQTNNRNFLEHFSFFEDTQIRIINEQKEFMLSDKEFEYFLERMRGKFMVKWKLKDGVVVIESITTINMTCKKFDKEQRICTAYEDRPQLCRNFGNTCGYEGCEFINTKKERDRLELEKWKKENPDEFLSMPRLIEGKKSIPEQVCVALGATKMTKEEAEQTVSDYNKLINEEL